MAVQYNLNEAEKRCVCVDLGQPRQGGEVLSPVFNLVNGIPASEMAIL
jgi:hypothetical protein